MLIGNHLNTKGISDAINTCLMTDDEIKRENIIKSVSITSLKALTQDKLTQKTDGQGGVFMCSTDKTTNHQFDDPFPKWLH